MFTSATNPVLRKLRDWDADPTAWARILRGIDSGKAKPNSKEVKQVLAACQLGPARLVPYDCGFIIKGGNHNQSYSGGLWDAIDHARKVLDRYVSVYNQHSEKER
jgi:hypothetical protein